LGYDTWEGYCIEKRNIAKSYAYYLVACYEISTIVESKGLPIPQTENHARDYLAERYPEQLEVDITGERPRLKPREGYDEGTLPDFMRDRHD